MDVMPFARKGRFWRGNVHTHSTRSDGRLPPAAVGEFYKGAGYDFLALTDHFWESCGYPITDTRSLRTKTFTTLIGAEIHAPLTAKGYDWHVVALGLPFDYAPPAAGETIQGMCRRAAAAGAFLGIAHPQWYGLTIEDALSIPEAHAVEVYNHGCAVESGRGDGWVVHDEALARGRRLNAYAADDAHFATPDAAGGWVMVKAEALRRGDFYSSQGPQIHAIEPHAEEVTVACSPAAWIVAVGAGTGTRCAQGQDLERATLPLDCFGEDGYFRITVTDDKGRQAWSNPIWR